MAYYDCRYMIDLQKDVMVIQIKGRITFDRKYLNKKLWIAFGGRRYVFPHDEVLEEYRRATRSLQSSLKPVRKAWSDSGCVHWPVPTEELREIYTYH